LKLSANAPQVGQNEDVVEAKIEGEENEIAFNYRFLLDLLNHFPGKEVVMEISGPLNPAMFKPVTATPQFVHIIMPVRVQT
jgi:DNA polymerase-3 subunit beta